VVLFVILACLSLEPWPASADDHKDGWSVEGQGTLFYSDDIGLFSATRRLSRDGDPTQPAIDTKLTNQGTDMIFEPLVNVTRSLTNGLGPLDLSIRGQGFIFAEHRKFDHGTLRVQAIQSLSSATRVKLRYYYAPDQFLGTNDERKDGLRRIVPENVTSHIWSTRLFHDVTPDLHFQLLGRYGLRRYNADFSERNLDFWTIGSHVGYQLTHRILLGLTYHYERGLAKGRSQAEFEDDTSYVNHYLTVDIEVELTERLSLLTEAHYDLNNWTSGLEGDERNGAHEDIYQGEVQLAYRLTNSLVGFVGLQHTSRKQSFESSAVQETNVGVGLSAMF